MTVTISRLYDSYPDAQQTVQDLEAAGLRSDDISIVASNADNWYKTSGRKVSGRKDRDHDGAPNIRSSKTRRSGMSSRKNAPA